MLPLALLFSFFAPEGAAPLDGQLMDQIEEVDLGMEGALSIRGQLVELFQDGQLLRLQER